MAIVAGLIVAAGAVAGASISSSASSRNVNATNAANANLNQANMDWQERMSDTAVQRRMADLQKAGLNPSLAAEGGGASSPSFSPIPMQRNPDAGMVGQGIGSALATAVDVKSKLASIEQIKAQTDAIRAGQPAPGQPAAVLAQTQAETNKAVTSAQNIEQSTKVMQAQVDEVRAKIDNLQSSTDLNRANAQTVQKVMDSVVALKNLEVQQSKLGMPKLENESLIQVQIQKALKQGTGPEGYSQWSNAPGVLKGVVHSIGEWFSELHTRSVQYLKSQGYQR